MFDKEFVFIVKHCCDSNSW